MQSLRRRYDRTWFASEVVCSAFDVFTEHVPEGIRDAAIRDGRVSTGRDTWRYDDTEEFLAAIGEPCDGYTTEFTHAYVHDRPGAHVSHRAVRHLRRD